MISDTDTSASPAHKQIGLTLLCTARAWRKRADSVAARLGLSDAAGWTLMTLHHCGDGTHLATLADTMGLEGPSVSRLLGTLIEAGLVERRDDPADRRAKTLHVTASGRETCNRLDLALNDVRAYLLQDSTPEEMAVLLRVCRRIQARAAVPPALCAPEDPT